MTRTSQYQGYKITVEVTPANRVWVSVENPAGKNLACESIDLPCSSLGWRDMFAKDGPQRAIIREAWAKGKAFVDARLRLEEALRHVPDWELK